jgi:pyridoxal phosphate enzyme (YggS family)
MNDQTIDLQERLAANLAQVRSNIAQAAERVGRSSADIALIAVSKTVPIEALKIAYNLGVTDFGENRVQDALPKISEFRPRNMRWHMIGHLQSNKITKVVGAFDMVQSVDRLHLAETLSRHAEEHGKRLPVLLQVNISGEKSKEGMTPTDAPLLARQVAALAAIDVQGLMTIAPLVENPEEVRPVFRGLRDLLERLRQEVPDCAWQHLSMGMTDDYRIAIEEGATMVRIGRAIFGERSYKGVSR